MIHEVASKCFNALRCSDLVDLVDLITTSQWDVRFYTL